MPEKFPMSAEKSKEGENPKEKALKEADDFLSDLFQLVEDGINRERPNIVRAHGFIDGYLKALIDTGVCSRREILDLIQEKRAGVKKSKS